MDTNNKNIQDHVTEVGFDPRYLNLQSRIVSDQYFVRLQVDFLGQNTV